MSGFSHFDGPFPWEPEWQERLEAIRERRAARRLQKRKLDPMEQEIAAAMLPGAAVKRRRGRPNVAFSIDTRRALLVLQVQGAMEERGQMFSQAEIIRRFKELAHRENYRTPNLSLFRATSIAPSVTRGLRKIEHLKAMVGHSRELSETDKI